MKDAVWSVVLLAAFALWWWLAHRQGDSASRVQRSRRELLRPAWMPGAEPDRPVIAILRDMSEASNVARLAGIAACLSHRDVWLVYVLEVPLQFELSGYVIADQAIVAGLESAARQVRSTGRIPFRRILRTRDWAAAAAQFMRETQPAAAVIALPADFDARDYEDLHAAGPILWVNLPA